MVAVGGGTGLPYNLSLVVGAVAGILAGVAVSAMGDGNEGDGDPSPSEEAER